MVHGRASFESEMKRMGLPMSAITDPALEPHLLKKLSFDNWEDMYAFESCSITPRRTPPIIAPGMLPIPPNTAATKALIPGIEPV